MKKQGICWMVVICLSLLLTGLPALAKGKGRDQSRKRPPGWEEGQKKGWQTDVPPGMERREGGLPPGLDETEKGDKDDDVTPDEAEEVTEDDDEQREGRGKGLKEKTRKEKRHEKKNKKRDAD